MNSSSRDLSHTSEAGHGALPMPSTEAALTDVEWRVLEVIVDGYEELCYGLSHIAGSAGLHRELTRGALRSLKDQGLAEFSRGLMNEDGELAGSGYGATRAGAHRYWNRRAGDGVGRAPRPPVIDGEGSRDDHNNTDPTPPTTEEEGA